MAISKSEDLFLLIKSMSKSEKRSFRLYAERIQDSKELEYMRLFDVIDKSKKPSDTLVLNALGFKDKAKYSNYKRHLYEQILISLRMTKKTGFKNFRVRELIDFAYVLYGKGLHMQSLKVLAKAKTIAQKEGLEFGLLTILEFEKLIQSRHITRTKLETMNDLLIESSSLAESINNRVLLSNLRLTMHRYYIELGYAKNQKQEREVKVLFQEQLKNIKEDSLSRSEKIHLNQAYVWYHYILNEFEKCFEYSERWISLFEPHKLDKLDVNLYFRANHYLLVCLFYLNDKKKFNKYLESLSQFRDSNYSKFDENSKIVSFLYVHQARLNAYIISKNFEEGILNIPRTLKRLNRYKNKLDEHKVMIFYFKIAWIYLMGGAPQKSVSYLTDIINFSNRSLRVDIQVYSRLMHLMVQLNLGNFNLINSLSRNYKRFIVSNDALQRTESSFLEFINQYSKAPLLDRKTIVKKYIQELNGLKKNKYEKRALIYLDIVSWMKTI